MIDPEQDVPSEEEIEKLVKSIPKEELEASRKRILEWFDAQEWK